MKRILALLLCIALFLPVFSFAEDEDGDWDMTDSVDTEDVDVDVDEDGRLSLGDSGDDSSDFELSDEVLDQMIGLFTADESIDLGELELNENLPDNVINILLVGLDVRGTKDKKLLSEQGQYAKRADVQIILSINRDDGTIKLTSIARNTFVDIPDRQYASSICNSWGHGVYVNGRYHHWLDTPDMCLRTINRNFEMNIRYYVAINFYGVVSIIESLGGVDLELTKEEANAINSYLREHRRAISASYDDKEGNREKLESVSGVQHLDGLQALMYARTRKVDNDFGRTGRTRKLLSALLANALEKIKNKELRVEDLLLNEVPMYLQSNMNGQTMWEVINLVLQGDVVAHMDAMDSLVEEYRIPEDGAWSYGTDHYGNSVVKLHSKQETTERLHDFIYGAYYPSGF